MDSVSFLQMFTYALTSFRPVFAYYSGSLWLSNWKQKKTLVKMSELKKINQIPKKTDKTKQKKNDKKWERE